MIFFPSILKTIWWHFKWHGNFLWILKLRMEKSIVAFGPIIDDIWIWSSLFINVTFQVTPLLLVPPFHQWQAWKINYKIDVTKVCTRHYKGLDWSTNNSFIIVAYLWYSTYLLVFLIMYYSSMICTIVVMCVILHRY